MAEGTIRSKDILECAVCLQTCVHPAQLPCGHIFCYLCVKGFANQNKRCAMCRQEIPRDFIEQPHLLHVLQPLDEITESFDGAYQWFYEGRNGWWQYDERTSKELENSYKNGDKTVELLIAGFLYIIDFENMLQLRRNDPSRRRQVKRDVATIAKKGVAGIRTNSSSTTSAQAEEETSSSNNAESSQTPDTPFNTPQRCTSGRESPNHHHDHEHELEAAVQLISNLRLDNSNNNNNNNNLSSSDAETNHHQE